MPNFPGLSQTAEDIATVAVDVATGATTEPSPGHLTPKAIFLTVRLQRDLWALEDDKRFAPLACDRCTNRSSLTEPARSLRV